MNWRVLSELEKSIIEKLLEGSIYGDKFNRKELANYLAKQIDEFGSLALRRVDQQGDYDGVQAHLLSSGYFDDDGQREKFGPMVNILVFEKNGFLLELQIYRDDGGPIVRPIVPDEIFMITAR